MPGLFVLVLGPGKQRQGTKINILSNARPVCVCSCGARKQRQETKERVICLYTRITKHHFSINVDKVKRREKQQGVKKQKNETCVI